MRPAKADYVPSTIFTIPLTPMNALPSAAFIEFKNQTLSIATGTRLDCALLVAGQDLVKPGSTELLNSCDAVAAAYGIVPPADLKVWNPSLATASPCILQPKLQYCVQRVLIPPPQNATSYCLTYAVAPIGYTCKDFTTAKTIRPASFIDWNPSVGINCANWKTGTVFLFKYD